MKISAASLKPSDCTVKWLSTLPGMIDEDQKEGYAAEKIEPNVARRRRDGSGRYLAALGSDKEPDKLLRQFGG